MKRKRLFPPLFLFILFAAGITACRQGSPVDGGGPLCKLTQETASCTEAWIRLSAAGIPTPAEAAVYLDGREARRITLVSQDTVVRFDSLEAGRSYAVSAVLSTAEARIQISGTAATLPVTADDYTWRTWTFGGGASSLLYDAAIFDTNDIWVCGEIYLPETATYDSLGRWIDPYNLIHWDGQKWTLVRSYYNDGGINCWSPIHAMYAENRNSIWMSNCTRLHDGGFTNIPFNIEIPGDIIRMGGTSGNDFYIVGYNGMMARYDGQLWHSIAAGTQSNINDIIFVNDTAHNDYTGFAAVSSNNGQHDRKILTINKNGFVDSLSWNTGRLLSSIWTLDGKIIYTAGEGIYHNKTGRWEEQPASLVYYTECIRGQGLNDIFAVGDYGIVTHFNGVRWKEYPELAMYGVYCKVAQKGDLTVMVGFAGGRAIIRMGRR